MNSEPIKVLLIEDNPADSRLIREQLGEARAVWFDLATAQRLSEGMERLTRDRVDVVLLDLSLPDSRGLDTFSQLHKGAPCVPVVVLTGLADDALAVEAVQCGAQDYLLKGEFDSHLLARSMRYAIERHKAEETLRQRNRDLALLNHIIAASASGAEPIPLLEAACREIARAFELPRVAVALLDDDKTGLTIVAEHRAGGLPSAVVSCLCKGAANHSIPAQRLAAARQLMADPAPLMLRSGLPCDALPGDEVPGVDAVRQMMRRLGTRSLLRVALVNGDQVLGCLTLHSDRERSFSADDINLASRVADQVASALAHARLAQAQRRLIAIVEQMAEAVITTNQRGIIEYVNPAFERLTGYHAADAIGRHVGMLDEGEQESEAVADLRATIKEGRGWHGQLVNRRKDGTTFTADVTSGPVRDESGAIASYVTVERDITREVQLEEQYRQAQKMEAIGRLTGGIAHDFNNMLTAINGFAELIQLQLPPDHPTQEMLDRVLNSGRRAASLVGQLLAFSRKQMLQPKVLDLNARVRDMHHMLQRVIGEDIDLLTVLSPDLWPIKADPTQMEQVVVNLAVNARDAMPGGGKLTIETANVTLDETYTATHAEVQPGDYAMLAVNDTGAGMSKEVQAHLFEPYFTTKGLGHGTGLGLATIYGIVKQSGGHISVYSEVGTGTTFKIYLPRALEVLQAAVAPDRWPHAQSGSETILLVEDNEQVLEVTRQVLTRQGYTLLEASDGREALQRAAAHAGDIHLLVTDVVMPGMGGETLAQQLAALRPGLKVLFMSGYTDNAIVHHNVLDASVAFLQKPFTAFNLARKVRLVLDRAKKSE